VIELLGIVFSATFLAQMLRITVPYALAALGGVFAERSGVIDLALEAKLLVGAFTAAGAADASGSIVVAAFAGVLGGTAVGAVQGLLVLRLRAEPVVTGVALNLLAYALTRYLLKIFYGSTANAPDTVGFTSSVWANPLFWTVCALVPLMWLLMSRTRFGLRLRAVGEHPEAAAAAGIGVVQVRLFAILVGGALAGLGGAWLALANGAFVAEMSSGRGYIALAAVIMGGWRPLAAVAACLLFGFAEALQFNLQAADLGVPRELAQMLPYVLTMIVLAGFVGRRRAPAALGKEPE
jgi:ABC-type uncharacterized transport system permease subunit